MADLLDLDKDETSLVWLSSGVERNLKLDSITKFISGQNTPVFQGNLRPEDCLSFPLIYNDGKLSLDLSCKDIVEAEGWFAGLKTLVSLEHCGRSKVDGWSDGLLHFDDPEDLISNSPSNRSINTILEGTSLDTNLNTSASSIFSSSGTLAHSEKSDVTAMHVKGNSSDVFRVSVSSAPSTSSHGSAQDDCDALGDVYVWGEIICDNSVNADKHSIPFSTRTDILLPKPLESNLVLDVHHVACGVRHAALVTRQGEVFTWGEESGGRLGHGAGTDASHPRFVESLAFSDIGFVACGEFHTCAVSLAGELYTWGDGTHNVGNLGHGTHVSHWIPKRVSGPLEGLQIAHVTCGPWHTALITSAGQLFTFGDGTFGVLGHGNRESISYPREVESLMGLKTIAVACGVWHTAAIVEVIVTQSSASVSSGKLFTWGDGDKYRLGHGDKEPRLKPTCVPSLIDYNFHKLACGHSLSVGLTTSGQVFTMGSTVYGQLGNPHSEGKLPCLVEDRLASEFVGEVACGSYHVAVLTARSEVYTWGKGANGRLGHGDLEDRRTPTLVEALKDRHIKQIACGSNFTASVCHHKWVSGAEQSQCSACKQAFGFTRKRHNCYNCGLVHCHSCSSRKALRAAMAPNPGKPYRVCDSCYVKLNKVLDAGGVNNRRNVLPRFSGENKDKFDKADIKVLKASLPSNLDLIKNLDSKAVKQTKKTDSLSLIRAPQVLQPLHLKGIGFSGGFDLQRAVPRTVRTSGTHSVNSSRAVSPFSRKSSPPRSATPIPTISGLSLSKNVTDSLRKTNEHLNNEVQKLQAQVDSLRQRCEIQEFELQKSVNIAQEANVLAAEESGKSKAAKEVIKSLTAQLKDMAERLPLGVDDSDDMRPVQMPNGTDSQPVRHHSYLNGENQLKNDAINVRDMASPTTRANVISAQNSSPRDLREANGMSAELQNRGITHPNGRGDLGTRDNSTIGEMTTPSTRIEELDSKEPGPLKNGGNGFKSRSPTSAANQVEAEWIEQYEPGVYITLMALRDGTRDLKRVRFSRRRFGEHQAETWWSENREKVYEKYNVRISDRTSQAP